MLDAVSSVRHLSFEDSKSEVKVHTFLKSRGCEIGCGDLSPNSGLGSGTRDRAGKRYIIFAVVVTAYGGYSRRWEVTERAWTNGL